MTSAPVVETEQHSVNSTAFEIIVISLALAQGALGFAVSRHWFWLAVPLSLVVAHFMHGLLIGFHEASHGLLRRSRRLNEFDGVLIGVFSFLPFTLYRVAHQSHHMHLATERDVELWPFVHPQAPRWTRCLAAFLELTAGLLYSPFLFLRLFFRRGSSIRSHRVRRRVWAELALTAVFWATLLSGVAWFGLWQYFVWIYLVPAVIAGNLQSWRKYIEHVGLTSDTENGSTRSIIPGSWLGRMFAFTLLHEPYHGIHHQHAGLPHTALPKYTAMLEPKNPGERVPFISYRHALPDVFRSLADPRVGAQWNESL